MECLDAAPVLVLLFQGRGPGCLGQRADSLRGRGGQFYGGGAEFTVDLPKTTGCANHCGASRGVGGGEIWRNYVFRPRRYRDSSGLFRSHWSWQKARQSCGDGSVIWPLLCGPISQSETLDVTSSVP